MESRKGCIASSNKRLSVMPPCIGQRSFLPRCWTCVLASRRILDFHLRKWFMASDCDLPESFKKFHVIHSSVDRGEFPAETAALHQETPACAHISLFAWRCLWAPRSSHLNVHLRASK
ncbi:hypothetical protein AVEN_143842-1 [Araneus ventricosus]|uniref:Uncharacterized protein n=1 Tax=Araneus ventricosus TaxID=182803 RepID=A0A4Y2MJX2_ARAVE|nr:hypothetical protein AVEN_143842-1 [Araneus ventricosus]